MVPQIYLIFLYSNQEHVLGEPIIWHNMFLCTRISTKRTFIHHMPKHVIRKPWWPFIDLLAFFLKSNPFHAAILVLMLAIQRPTFDSRVRIQWYQWHILTCANLDHEAIWIVEKDLFKVNVIFLHLQTNILNLELF